MQALRALLAARPATFALGVSDDFGRDQQPAAGGAAVGASPSVRPKMWTCMQHDGPNPLGTGGAVAANGPAHSGGRRRGGGGGGGGGGGAARDRTGARTQRAGGPAGRRAAGKTLHLPCVSTTVGAKTLPLLGGQLAGGASEPDPVPTVLQVTAFP